MVCKFVYIEVIILTCISDLTEEAARRCFVKKVLYKFPKSHRKPKSLLDWLHIQERLCVSWLTNLCEGTCFFRSLGSSMVHKFDYFMTLKKLLRFCSDCLGLRFYITIVYSPLPNIIETCFCVVFITPLFYGRSFFPNVTLLTSHIKF